MNPAAPVIIIGMHRSGTSLLTRVLQRSGFFMGTGASRNEEAAFTNAINAWLFREASATWDRPEPMDALLADEPLKPVLIDYMDGLTRGPASWRFLGLRRGIRYGNMHRQGAPWGWKDPRNTWTLPLWLEVFPNARILHIARHGVDVAESLRVRRWHVFGDRRQRYQRFRGWYVNNPFAPKRRGFGPQVRCAALEGGLALWQLYVSRARQHMARAPERCLEIRYEDLLTDPLPTLRKALEFCGCQPAASVLRTTADRFDASRAHVWRGKPDLLAFARDNRMLLEELGYTGVD